MDSPLITLAERYRMLTSPLRKLPDFIIIGAQKCGTSSLFYYLSQHPMIRMPVQKEIHYYNYYADHGKSPQWYRSHFPLKIKCVGKLTGEASPSYLYSEAAAVRIKGDVPAVKLIVLLRDPVDRAYSEYNMHVRQLKQRELPTFEGAISNDDLSQEVSRIYLVRGRYAEYIRNWLKHFNRDQFMFIKAEDFYHNPRHTLEKVYGFLGLEESYPQSLRPQEVGTYSGLSDQTRQTPLNGYFSQSNRDLIELLGEEYGW